MASRVVKQLQTLKGRKASNTLRPLGHDLTLGVYLAVSKTTR